tara:strand:- start:434 stop:616 length:183 start_codon:yes stop_codon:yes gene_type:complete
MFDDDRPKPKTQDFPRNLEFLSVADLNEYVDELESEITRVQGDIMKKKASQDAAASVFKF